MMRTDEVRYGVTFMLSLLLSWTLTTGILALAFWSGDRIAGRATVWASVWVFTVGVPTMQALRIHRVLGDLVRDCPTIPAQTRRGLAHARFVVLMCGSMTVLLLFALQVLP